MVVKWRVVELLLDADGTRLRRSLVDEAPSKPEAEAVADALNAAGHVAPEPGQRVHYEVTRWPPEGV